MRWSRGRDSGGGGEGGGARDGRKVGCPGPREEEGAARRAGADLVTRLGGFGGLFKTLGSPA